MSVTGMYAYAIKVSQGKFHGTTEERDGKLVIKGTVGAEAEKNAIWDAIKTIPTWKNDVVADIQVTGAPNSSGSASPAAAALSAKTYTVKAGDTLSHIAKEHLGSAGAYMKLFELNKDQLANPDQILPGQVLRLS